MNENVNRLIKDAIDVIETKGWTKGSMINGDEQVCTLGAMDVARHMGVLRQPDVDWIMHAEAAKAIVREQLIKHIPYTPNGLVLDENRSIPGINDASGTTQEDILLGLKHALHRAQEDE